MELRIFANYNYILIVGNDMETRAHKHHAVEICLSIDQPLSIKQDEIHLLGKIIIIDKDVDHRLENSKNQMIILVDSESSDAFCLKEILKQDKAFSSNMQFSHELKNVLDKFKNANNMMTIEDSDFFYNRLMDMLIDADRKKIIFDERIEEALEVIKNLEVKKISAAELAKKVCLSESRLLHLFKSAVGIPLRRYLLWLRIKDAIIEISKGSSFTYAAYLSGFSDAAHLTRTCIEMFGVNLEMLFNNSKFIQVIM